MKRILATLAVAVALTVLAGTAWAYWSAGSVPGGGGAAAASSVNQGATPSASAAGSTVTVSWTATTLANGQPVTGYLVKRYDATTSAAQTVLTACTGTITATSCVESNVPNGSWKYAVTPVLAANWQGTESAKSATVVVNSDATAPTNSISLSSVTGGAFLSAGTVYYHGSIAGSLRLTNAVADAGSGPASSATATLGGTSTGWSHTPGTVSTPAAGPYVSSPFSWTAGTTSSPTESVTGRDVAGNTAVTSLTFTNDSTAPTAGTISYAAGYASSPAASISFTTGTDSGSGIATRRLQRATAALNGSTCGTYGAFADIGADGPTSPYVDGSLATGCYQYRYVVTDQVGNQHVATSANVVKVGYAAAVDATTGLLSYWRLGEAASGLTSSDSFTGTTGTALTAHTGEIGAGWTHRVGSASQVITAEDRVRRSGNDYSVDYASATPASSSYSVEADLHYMGGTITGPAGVVGRLSTTGTATYYVGRWETDNTWNIVRFNGTTATTLGSTGTQPALVADQTYRIRLELTGTSPTTLRLYVNGVLKVGPITDSTAAEQIVGRAGIMNGEPGTSGTDSATSGLHLDNFQVTPSTYPRAADSKGSNTGDYENGVTQGVAGAIGGDPNTAATFDGVNDYVQMTGTTGIPVGASSRSVEAWFKTSSAARQVLFDYGNLNTNQEFGLWVDPGATTMTAWGWGGGNDKTFTMPSAVNNGAWHQVVLTWNGTALILYIDGVPLPAQTATRDTVMDAHGFGIGAVVNPDDTNSGGFFNGSIDDVSLYTSMLSPATVTTHYLLGTAVADVTGPAGGSVDASGLVGTGARYATSTTLTLALAPGTDLSGIATTGNLLQRASASITDGTCGTFGSYAVVATDPTSPTTDVVTNGYCYRYQYVVSDAAGNATTYTSPDIKVDVTTPAAPSLAFSSLTNASWPGSGSTVYYRSAATSGSIRLTATASAPSGIAGYAFPALGSGWTSTPGGTGVTTYSWSAAGPAAPGTKSVTATNNAGTTSAAAPFTLTADDAAPTGDALSYTGTTTSSTSVTVSLTTGTDSGSGIGTRLLQRAAAPLTGTTCGAFGLFATVPGGTNPTSPSIDTVTRGFCYKYQYVVSDNVGNQHIATSANVVTVLPTYVNAVNATSGLVNYFRLGEATTSADSMTGTSGATLQSRAGEIAASWTKVAVSDADAVLTPAGRVRKAGDTSGAIYYPSGTPASPDYTVEADVYVASNLANDMAGVLGRVDPTLLNGYYTRYEQPTQRWVLYKVVNGTLTSLGQSATQALVPLSTYRLALDLAGTRIRVLVDGVQVVSVTDTAITATGRAGIAMGFGPATTNVTNTAGLHLDNFRVSPEIADSHGTNDGNWFGGVLQAIAGAIAGDADTAATFDGTNDYGTVARQVSDDFSIELWFKSTQGIGTGTQWTSAAGLVDGSVAGVGNDFGISLRSDGKVVAGIGTPDVSIVSTTGGYDNGAWHHVVFTRTKSTGALALYVDGVAAGTATGNTASLTGAASLSFGRIQSGGNYFAGSLDDVSIYSVALSAASISAHFAAAN